MTSVASELSAALFSAILHSIWQGCALALIYVVLSPRLRSSQSYYLLAIWLFAAAPISFVWTFIWAYGQASINVEPTVFYEISAPTLDFYFTIAWCIGVAFVGGRFFCGWLWLQLAIVRTATDVPPPIQALFDASKRSLAIPNRVAIRASSLVRSPMLIGVIKPIVLLPISMTSGVPASMLSAVLTHELLHLRRLDHVAVLLQAVGETLLFYHPAVRWLSMEARRAREYRCDDDSIRLLGDKYEYARTLVTLEQSQHENAVPALMMNGGELMDRVERILVTQTKTKHSRFNFVGLAAFISVAFLTYSLSVADELDQTEDGSTVNTQTVSISWLPPSVTQWDEYIEKAAANHGVPANVLALVLFIESGGNEQAISSAGARGLMQVMPQTGSLIAEQRNIAGFEVEQLFDPQTNIDFGAWYLAQQLSRFSEHDEESVALAISAYNAGPKAVTAYLAGDQQLPDETIRYRDRLLSMLSEKDSSSSTTIESYIARMRQQLPDFVAPVQGRVTSRFGFDGGQRGTHNGIDIAAAQGTPVIAPVAGRIAYVGEDTKRGKFVTVRHAMGIESHYFHLSEIAVELGARIAAGEALGEVGSTGLSKAPHLHFEVREFGKPVSPELYGFAVGQLMAEEP